MPATVHNIHHRNRQCPRLYTAKIRVQWTFRYFCCRSRRCHRHPENCISAKFPFISAAVKSLQHLIQPSLVQYIHPHDLRRDLCIHMVSRVLHTFSHVTCLSVTQFDCFIFPGGRTRRYTCTPHGFLSSQYLHLDRRIPSRIKDFSRIYISDRYIFIHKKYLLLQEVLFPDSVRSIPQPDLLRESHRSPDLRISHTVHPSLLLP